LQWVKFLHISKKLKHVFLGLEVKTWILSYSPNQEEFGFVKGYMSYGCSLHCIKIIKCNRFFFTDFFFARSEEKWYKENLTVRDAPIHGGHNGTIYNSA